MSYQRVKVIRALQARGFTIIREGGRHTIVGRPASVSIAIPRHRELNRFTVKGIAEDAGVDWDEFKREIS